MKHQIEYTGLWIVFFLFGMSACAPVIQPRVSSAEFLVEEDKIPGKIEVFVSEDFRSYVAEKTDISEFKTWKFELGPVAIDTFRFSLESRFEQVSVKLGNPKFPVDSDGVFYAAVQPAFSQFGASDPVIFRFEDYTAQVEFLVTVFNSEGKTILSQTYSGEGTQQGSIGYADPGHAAYPVAVQNAIKDAVNKVVNGLVEIASRDKNVAVDR